MAIELIINGFFRSGTSALWKIAKESNSRHACFYEPCHPRLHELIQQHPLGAVNPMHGMELFNEYHEHGLSRSFENDLISQGGKVPQSFEAIRERIAPFGKVESPVILQTNRWHCYLGAIGQEFGCYVIHVIRSPYEVWHSIQNAQDIAGRLRLKLKQLVGDDGLGTRFAVDDFFDCQTQNKPWLKRNNTTAFERFLVVWTLSNHAATRDLEGHGAALTLSRIAQHPELLLDLPVQGVRLEVAGRLRTSRGPFLSSKEETELLKKAENLGIGQELGAVLDICGCDRTADSNRKCKHAS